MMMTETEHGKGVHRIMWNNQSSTKSHPEMYSVQLVATSTVT